MSPAPDSRCLQAEQSVGWAVHSLEPAEEAAVAAHLPTCEQCRKLVRRTDEVLAMLGSSDETFEPPAELRAGLLARVAETPQQLTLPLPSLPLPSLPLPSLPLPSLPLPSLPLPSLHAPAPPPPAFPTQTDLTPQLRFSPEPQRLQEPVRATPGRAPSGPSDNPLPRRGRRRLALVAAAVVVALGIGGVAVRTALVEQQRPAETSQAQQLASLVSQLQHPGDKAAMLAPPNGAPVAAVVVADGERKLVTVGMTSNSTSTHTYVLWGTGVGAPRPLGAFDVSEGSTGPRSVGPLSAADNFTGYAISLEPGRSVPAAPTQVVASGAVQG